MESDETIKSIGRPPEYRESLILKVREYLNSCVDVIEEYHKTRGDKSDTYERIVRVNLPTIEGLALYLGVSVKSIYNWEKQHENFLQVIGELRQKQANSLISNGLSGTYNPTIAKVLLTKHGYREGVDQTTNGKELPTPIMQIVKKANVLEDISNNQDIESD